MHWENLLGEFVVLAIYALLWFFCWWGWRAWDSWFLFVLGIPWALMFFFFCFWFSRPAE